MKHPVKAAPPVRAAIYCRISKDTEREGLGVARQLKDCRQLAQQRGWQVIGEYTDNDVSATRSKRRPEYTRMLTDAAAGRITGLVVWDVDRLTRTPRELEDVIDLADRVGLALASVGGEIDLSTPQGRLTARIKGTVARHEAEQMSRRIRRQIEDRAAAGRPHGFAPYGFDRVAVGVAGADGNTRTTTKQNVVNPAQAKVIRAVAKRLLREETLRSIAVDLNAKGVLSPRGRKWSSTSLRQVMSRESIAGLRRHHGQELGPAEWQAIIPAATFRKLSAKLSDPSRRSNKGSVRRHLLSGIAKCGKDGCGGPLVVNVGRLVTGKNGKQKRQPPAYACQRCYGVRRKQEDVDDLVTAAVLARLMAPGAAEVWNSHDDGTELQAAHQERDRLSTKLDQAADDYSADKITGEQLRRITAATRLMIDKLDATIRQQTPAPVLSELAGSRDAVRRWEALPLEAKRSVIELLTSITVLPAGPGVAFDPALVVIKDRQV